jgi:hypothetical protein
VAITSDGQLGFVALSSGQVVMLDVPDHSIVTSIAVGGTPHFIITGLYPPARAASTKPQQTTTAPAMAQPFSLPILFMLLALLAGALSLGMWLLYRRRYQK